MKTFVYIAQSLDGFIAKSDGSLDWLDHDSNGEDYGYKEFMKNIDVLLMGANTFRIIREFNEWYYDEKRVLILSKKLTKQDIPERLQNKVEISNLSPNEILFELKKNETKGIYVDGGKLIQSFLKEGLIDELIITQIPIMLGSGISLFGNLNKEIRLELNKAKTFKSGLVQLNYRVLH